MPQAPVNPLDDARMVFENNITQKNNLKNQEETNTWPSSAISSWSIAAEGLTIVKNILQRIPKFILPNNPAREPILPFLKFSYWSGFFFQWISPAALALGYLQLADSIERFYKAENRNYERYLDLFVAITSAAVSTAMFCLGGAKIAILLALSAAALNAAVGLFNTIKYFAFAVFAKDKHDRQRCLIRAGKQFISIFTNSLSFAVGFFLGIKLSEAKSFNALGNIYTKISSLFTALTFSTLASIAADSAKTSFTLLNNLVKHPKRTVTNMAQDLKREFHAHPVKSILKLPFQTILLPLRIATLPLQVIFYGCYKAITKCLDYFKPIKESDKNTINSTKPNNPGISINPTMADRKAFIKLRAQKQIDRYQTTYTTEQARQQAPEAIRAKWHLLDKIANTEFSSNSLNQHENEAKKISSNIYTSFFRRKSNTMEIMEEACEIATHPFQLS